MPPFLAMLLCPMLAYRMHKKGCQTEQNDEKDLKLTQWQGKEEITVSAKYHTVPRVL